MKGKKILSHLRNILYLETNHVEERRELNIRNLELFHLPTLMHNSLFINTMYVTLLSSTYYCAAVYRERRYQMLRE